MSNEDFEKCPVCEHEIKKGQKECPRCGAILDLFEVDVDDEIPEESMEKVMDLVLNEEEEKEVIEDIKDLGLSDEDLPEDIKEDFEKSEKESIEEIYTYECVECGAEVRADATKCPDCGVIFEDTTDEEVIIEEEIEEFDLEMEEEIHVDFKEEIWNFKDKVKKLEDSDLELNYLQKDIEKLEQAHEDDKKEEGEKLIEKIEDEIEQLEKLNIILDKSNNYIKILDGKIDISDVREKIEDIYEGVKIGEFNSALKIGKKIKGDLENKFEDLSHDWLVHYIEKRTDEIEENIDFLEPNIDTNYLKEKLQKINSQKENLLEAVHHTENCLEESKKSVELLNKIKEIRDHEDKLREKDIDVEEYTAKLDEMIESLEKGEYYSISDEIEATREELKDLLNREKEIEKITEERKQKDLFKKIQRKLPYVQDLLQVEKEFGLDIEREEKLIESGIEFTKENDYEKALEKLKEVEDLIKEKLDSTIEEKIQTLRLMEDYGKENLPLEEIESYWKNENYEKILEMMENKVFDIDFQKNIEEKINEDLSGLKEIIKDIYELEIEKDDYEKRIAAIEEKIEKKEWPKCIELLDGLRSDIEENLLNYLRNEISRAKTELKNAKEKGRDISKPVQFLKKSNKHQKNGKLKESVDALKNYKRIMDEL